jgi:uncharacterized protein (DUF1330 family)
MELISMVAFVPDVFEAFLKDEDDLPVVMVNLLQFAPDGGAERYVEYLRLARPILARFGAEIVYGGAGFPVLTTGGARRWDAVVLVRYPNRTTFKLMVEDPDYCRAFEVGQSAISDIVLQPTQPNEDLM